VWVGVAKSSPADAGWYVYCNGRMVIRADQTLTTGWGMSGEKSIPKYHNEFARFRGFTYFTSENASLLPWNTTKRRQEPRFRVYAYTNEKGLDAC